MLFTETPIMVSMSLTAILSDWIFSWSATPQLHFGTNSAKLWPSALLISVAWRLGTWKTAIFILFLQPFLGNRLWLKLEKEAKSCTRIRASYYKAKLDLQRYLLFWKGHLLLTFWKSHGKINTFPSQSRAQPVWIWNGFCRSHFHWYKAFFLEEMVQSAPSLCFKVQFSISDTTLWL